MEAAYAYANEKLFACLHFSGQYELVKDEVGLLKVEDDVELADGAEVLVEDLDVAVDQLEGHQLVLLLVHGEQEEQRGVPGIGTKYVAMKVPVLGSWAFYSIARDVNRHCHFNTSAN